MHRQRRLRCCSAHITALQPKGRVEEQKCKEEEERGDEGREGEEGKQQGHQEEQQGRE